jgi:hypothetical protein
MRIIEPVHPTSAKLEALARQSRVLQAFASTTEEADRLGSLALLYERQAADMPRDLSASG